MSFAVTKDGSYRIRLCCEQRPEAPAVQVLLDGELLRTIPLSGEVSHVQFSPDERFLALASQSGQVFVSFTHDEDVEAHAESLLGQMGPLAMPSAVIRALSTPDEAAVD